MFEGENLVLTHNNKKLGQANSQVCWYRCASLCVCWYKDIEKHMFDGYRRVAGEEKYQLDIDIKQYSSSSVACNHYNLLSACVWSDLIQDVMFPTMMFRPQVPLGGGRCRNHLRTPHMPSRLVSSARSWTLTVGFTSSCGLPEERITLSAESQLALMAFY